MSKNIKARYTNNPSNRTATYVKFCTKNSDYFADSQLVLNKKYYYVYFTRGDASKLLNMNNIDICECLQNVTFNIGKDKLCRTTFVVSYDKIGFKCCKEQPDYNNVSVCLQRMRTGHCPYAFAKMLFPDSYKAKQK